jgi:hypothetical protein
MQTNLTGFPVMIRVLTLTLTAANGAVPIELLNRATGHPHR